MTDVVEMTIEQSDEMQGYIEKALDAIEGGVDIKDALINVYLTGFDKATQ